MRARFVFAPLVFAAACARPPTTPAARSAPALGTATTAGASPTPALGMHDGARALDALRSPGDAARLCEASLARARAQHDALAARARSDADDAAVLDALHALDVTLNVAIGTSMTFARVHVLREARVESATCLSQLQALAESVPRGDVLARLARARGRSAGEARYLADLLAEAKESGASLAPEAAASFASLLARAREVRDAMSEAIARSTRTITVAPSRLAGLPAAFVAAHPPVSGNVALRIDAADTAPVLRFADDRALAAELFRDAGNRAYPENEPRLHELLDLRKRAAGVAGYASWADYRAASRMVGTRARTVAFLDELRSAIAPVNARYRKSLASSPAASKRAASPAESDAPWLEERLVRETYRVDAARYAEYFEVERTLPDALAAIGELFGMRFDEARDASGRGGWAPEVRVFDVKRDDGKTIARVYFDLYARAGKPTNVGSSLPLVPRTFGADAPLEIAILMNVAPPKPGAPSLLAPEQLATLLHETGHALHFMSLATTSAFFEREFDFYDVPSQVLELLAFRRPFLERVGRHYQTGEPMPPALASAVGAERPIYLWQRMRKFVVLGDTDVTFHGDAPPADTTAAYAAIFERSQPYAFDRQTHPDASMVLPTLNYDGNGHALGWGLAIAVDILGELEARGFGRDAFRDYVDRVLAPNAPAEERVASFLGRKWSTERVRAEIDRAMQ